MVPALVVTADIKEAVTREDIRRLWVSGLATHEVAFRAKEATTLMETSLYDDQIIYQTCGNSDRYKEKTYFCVHLVNLIITFLLFLLHVGKRIAPQVIILFIQASHATRKVLFMLNNIRTSLDHFDLLGE